LCSARPDLISSLEIQPPLSLRFAGKSESYRNLRLFFHPRSRFPQCMGIEPARRGLSTSTGSSISARKRSNRSVFFLIVPANHESNRPDFSAPLRICPPQIARGILKVAAFRSASHPQNARTSLAFHASGSPQNICEHLTRRLEATRGSPSHLPVSPPLSSRNRARVPTRIRGRPPRRIRACSSASVRNFDPLPAGVSSAIRARPPLPFPPAFVSASAPGFPLESAPLFRSCLHGPDFLPPHPHRPSS
jgi:hypothetical protein